VVVTDLRDMLSPRKETEDRKLGLASALLSAQIAVRTCGISNLLSWEDECEGGVYGKPR